MNHKKTLYESFNLIHIIQLEYSNTIIIKIDNKFVFYDLETQKIIESLNDNYQNKIHQFSYDRQNKQFLSCQLIDNRFNIKNINSNKII